MMSEGYDRETERLTALFEQRTKSLVELFAAKNHAYGPSNIAAFGLRGVIVRLADKMARLKRLGWDGVEVAKTEGLEDTLRDMAAYSVIGLMLLDGEWQ